MKNLKNQIVKPWTLAVAFVLTITATFLGKKIYDYSAAPSNPKDCDFSYPAADDGGKPLVIAAPTAPSIQWEQFGGVINDASCLNKTPIYGIARIRTVDDVGSALAFARDNNLKVTAAGRHHSMGGQSFFPGGLVLDMMSFDHMTLDREHKVLRVESGANWAQIQEFLDGQGLSVKAMQSINIFSVGGTLSVNAHGIAHDPGQVASTVKSLRVMLSNGIIETASPSENPDLFRHVLGGYGLFGVILDVDLDVVDNEAYRRETAYLDYRDFPAYFQQHVHGNPDIGLFYARLSVAPGSYLKETEVQTYAKTPFDGSIPPLAPDNHSTLERFVINFSKTGGFGRWFRWTLEKRLEPRFHDCVSRNQAMNGKEVCLVSRNQEMFDSMAYLQNRLSDADILQEYFIPQKQMPAFVDALRDVVTRDGANLLNVTVRGVTKDNVTSLPYANSDMFAFVLYFNQKLNEQDSRILQKTTSDLIDAATDLDGSFYLPYQLYYSREQLRKAYPTVDDFFQAKKRFDPVGLFDNKFYDKYGR